ncbi:uncharacterized protein DUF3810 [Chitinophaga dinghuensis]|uniref:Uncharacterized protein DUF3810 n=1 Tax=Chitinophaga dinghuensis TaxID=1539050 RepID=A0A327WK02_9BACT|nr:DUF3810 domain-containing protein [Chitinophaga dinghuensis]RAJ88124.1 uncharacterized protein DUF3810 [Chitinophaga dinghuensis]
MELKTKIRVKVIRIVLTLTAILLLKGLMGWSSRFGYFYFNGWYKWTSAVFRQLTGIVPFSVGDVIYTLWIITGIFYLLKLCYKLIRMEWAMAGYQALKGIHALLNLFLAFLVLWGLNYERQPLTPDTRLVSGPYNTDQLYRLSDTLVQLVNRDKLLLGDTGSVTGPDTSTVPVFKRAVMAYDAAAGRWPAFRYEHPSIKKALFGEWLNYTGTTGYLNPWTNEAQVNTASPEVMLPFITCHEIAHQLGYAPEEDANFVGYLAATSTTDSRFRYSANLEMFLYSVRQLSWRDTTLASQVWHKAVPGVRKDYKAIVQFYRKYEGKVDDYSAMFYDQYLKANKQLKGIRSYSEVTGWLITYFDIR